MLNVLHVIENHVPALSLCYVILFHSLLLYYFIFPYFTMLLLDEDLVMCFYHTFSLIFCQKFWVIIIFFSQLDVLFIYFIFLNLYSSIIIFFSILCNVYDIYFKPQMQNNF